MLTPKVHKDFANYLLKQKHFYVDKDNDVLINNEYLMNYPIEMQFGIYQDYFIERFDFPLLIDWNYVEKPTQEQRDNIRLELIKEASKLAEQRL